MEATSSDMSERDLDRLVERLLGPVIERIVERKLAERGGGEDEWLDVAAAAELTHTGQWHVRQFIKRLQAQGSPDVYQPNGPGTKPLRVRRSALRNLRAA